MKIALIAVMALSFTASASSGCRKNSDCPAGKICATVKGDYPGLCAAGGTIKPSVSKETGCRKNADCGKGRICATVRGEYPGSCADHGGN